MDVKSENEDSLYGILFQETWVNFENYSPLSILSYCVLYNLGSQSPPLSVFVIWGSYLIFLNLSFYL